jgi:translocator protein
MKMKSFVWFVGFIGVSQLAGAVGSLFTVSSIGTWYEMLQKPLFAPPNWIFGPVWVLLYLFMGIATFLVFQQRGKNRGVKTALFAFAVQLVLNSAWSIIFFGMHNIAFALFEIVVLWIAIATTMLLFFRVSKVAGWLFVPYLAWVSFATYLNYAFWTLN